MQVITLRVSFGDQFHGFGGSPCDSARNHIDLVVDVIRPRGYIAAPLAPAVRAQVAELVDAQVSGTCGRKVVEVRVFSWAPKQWSVGL